MCSILINKPCKKTTKKRIRERLHRLRSAGHKIWVQCHRVNIISNFCLFWSHGKQTIRACFRQAHHLGSTWNARKSKIATTTYNGNDLLRNNVTHPDVMLSWVNRWWKVDMLSAKLLTAKQATKQKVDQEKQKRFKQNRAG